MNREFLQILKYDTIGMDSQLWISRTQKSNYVYEKLVLSMANIQGQNSFNYLLWKCIEMVSQYTGIDLTL